MPRDEPAPRLTAALVSSIVVLLLRLSACGSASSPTKSLLTAACKGVLSAEDDSGGLLGVSARDPSLDLQPAEADARKAGDSKLAEAIQSVGVLLEASFHNQAPSSSSSSVSSSLSLINKTCAQLGLNVLEHTGP